jgi:hypothetical protein
VNSYHVAHCATLALIKFELPASKLGRLAHEDGERFCSLSKQRNLPEEIDETADAVHEVLPLSILGAFVEARRITAGARAPSVPAMRLVRATSEYAPCCDDFA